MYIKSMHRCTIATCDTDKRQQLSFYERSKMCTNIGFGCDCVTKRWVARKTCQYHCAYQGSALEMCQLFQNSKMLTCFGQIGHFGMLMGMLVTVVICPLCTNFVRGAHVYCRTRTQIRTRTRTHTHTHTHTHTPAIIR